MSDGLTIKERIALLKQQNNKGDTPPTKSEQTRPVGKINIPSPGAGAAITKGGSNTPISPVGGGNSITEKIAAMKVSSAGATSNPNKLVASSNSPASTGPPSATGTAATTAAAGSSGSGGGEPKPMSIAERIAAMKAQSAAASSPPPTPGVGSVIARNSSTGLVKSSSNDAAVATSPNQAASAAPGAVVGSPSIAVVEPPGPDIKSTPTNRKGSIADKIAQLKASSASKGEPPIGGMITPGREVHAAKAAKRLSTQQTAFAAGLNMAMLRPGMTPPSLGKPHPTVEESNTATGEDEMSQVSESDATSVASSRRSSLEIKHMSLGRPSVASVRKSRGRSHSYVRTMRASTTELVAEDGVDIKDIIASTSTSSSAAAAEGVTAGTGTLDSVGEGPMDVAGDSNKDSVMEE